MSGHEPLNIVLVGRVGNGKSSTANNILKRAFKSKAILSSVTMTIQAESTKLDDEQVINVIDTTGLYDTEFSQEYVTKEIVKCIHAIVLVYDVKTRFSEEEAAIHVMMDVFGSKVTDYMIVALTGADQLNNEEVTPEAFMKTAPLGLQKILDICRQRHVFFDNKTKDETTKKAQREKFVQMVKQVLKENRGIPFTNELMIKMKESKEKSDRNFDDIIKHLIEQIEMKLKDELLDMNMRASIQNLEQELLDMNMRASIQNLEKRMKDELLT